ncbi:MAG: exonuclease SbcD [Mariniblastus sp.]|jgi:exonuclease SbcD
MFKFIHAADIPLYLISGNHDAANKMTRTLRMPENVTFFSADRPETALIPELDVAIHGQSFATAAVYDDLSEGYPIAKSGYFNVGVLHTCASGREGHDR